MAKLISLQQAAEQGLERLRLPIWANPKDHIKINIFDGQIGPWVHLFAPFNKECNGRDPVNVLAIYFEKTKEEWEPYNGPLPDSEEYKAEQASYEGCMSDHWTKDREGA